MKRIVMALFPLFAAQGAVGQALERRTDETPEAFADRVKPDSTELAHTVIETRALDTAQALIIAFYRRTIYQTTQLANYTDHSQFDLLLGYLLIPTGNGSYQRRLIDTIPPDGADPKLAAVFFANADRDPNKELVVLCTYDQRHYDFGGTSYGAFIYDYKNGKTRYLESLSSKFSGCDCDWRNGTRERTRYRTAGAIRQGLTRMGYKQ